MTSRGDLLAYAASQLGTYERTGQNDVLYADYWGITGYSWCYAYVQWCFTTLGIALPFITMYVPAGVAWSRDNWQTVERGGAPQPGDIVHFTWDMNEWPPTRPGTGDHVGIVEAWDGGDTIWTIEGNVGSPQGVWRMVRSIDRTVINFWRPLVYSDSGTEEDMGLTADQDRMLTALYNAIRPETAGRTKPNGEPIWYLPELLDVLMTENQAGIGAEAGAAHAEAAAANARLAELASRVNQVDASVQNGVNTVVNQIKQIPAAGSGEPFLDVEGSLAQATSDQIANMDPHKLVEGLYKRFGKDKSLADLLDHEARR